MEQIASPKAREPRMSVEQSREAARAAYGRLVDSLVAMGATLHPDINDIYRSKRFGNDRMIVRKENPADLIRTIARGLPHQIGLDAQLGDLYPNAVVWNPNDGSRGIEIAYLEGHGNIGGFVTVVGFAPSDRVRVREIPGIGIGLTGTDRSLVRCATGKILPEDVRFLMLRIPIDRFPVEQMTEGERETYEEWVDAGEPAQKEFISRGLTFERFLREEQLVAK